MPHCFNFAMYAVHRKPYAKYFASGLLTCIVLGVATVGWFSFSFFYPWGLRTELMGHQGWVICVAFAPDGRTLATGGEDRTVRLWDLSSCKERAILRGHTGNVVAVVFSPDGKLLATASRDGSVRLWEVDSGKQCALLLGHASLDSKGRPRSANAITFSPDGVLLASGGADKTVRLWEVASGRQRDMFQAKAEVCALVITVNGKLLASRTADGIITVWGLNSGKELRHFGTRLGMDCRSFRLLLVPNEPSFASNGSTNEKIKVWDYTTGTARATLTANLNWQNSPITAMAVAPSRKVLAGTTMFGAHMVFWDISSGKRLGAIHFSPRTSSIAFSPDSKFLASVHFDGTVKLWDASKLIPPRN